jgi:hypothetical protein
MYENPAEEKFDQAKRSPTRISKAQGSRPARHQQAAAQPEANQQSPKQPPHPTPYQV